jgi:hypothetical protein
MLHLIAEGRLFKLLFTWLLRALSMAALAGTVWLSIELWQGGRNSSQAIFGQLVFQALLALAGTTAAHLCWLRAQDVAAMPQTAGEVIIPLARLLLRLGGELYGSLMALLGTGGALMIWISAGDARPDLPELRLLLPGTGGEAFAAGAGMLLGGLVWAAMGLLGGYLASELLGLLCAIETNTRGIKQG